MTGMAIPVEFCEVWFQYLTAGDNEPMYTHLAFGVVAPISQAAVDAGYTAWITSWRTRAAGATTLVGGHILEGAVGGSIRWDSSVSPLTGTNGAQSVPQNSAFLARKSSALGGRRNRGRMYIPSVPEGDVDSAGVVLSATVTTWNVNLAAMMPGGSIHTAFGFLGDAVILHETGSQTPTTMTDLAMQNRIATQRRRLRR